MKKLTKFLSPALLAAFPLLSLAQTANATTILEKVYTLLTMIIPIILVLALIYFFWGLAKYILAAGSEDSKAEGRNIMIYGIIALFVMASVWGLVNFLQDSTGVGEGSAPVIELPSATI